MKNRFLQFSNIFDNFYAFLQPKLTWPKNRKNLKKSNFFKKSWILKNALNMIIWCNIEGKWPQRCLKTFFNVYMTFRVHFMQFLKNRKKSILKNFFLMHASINSTKFVFSGRISAKYHRGPKKYHLAPSRKKSLQITRRFRIPAWFWILMSRFSENPYFHT